jgi:hypothetical protein
MPWRLESVYVSTNIIYIQTSKSIRVTSHGGPYGFLVRYGHHLRIKSKADAVTAVDARICVSS